MFPLFRFFAVALFLGSVAFAAPVPKVKNPPDKEKILGKWQVIQRIDDGKDRGTGVEECFWSFKEEERTIVNNEKEVLRGTYTLDDKSKQIDLIEVGKRSSTHRGLYELDGDKLIVVLTPGSCAPRPESMDGKGCKIILKRVKD